MNITVFYAWQSDSPSATNRGFIRRAAESACERITADVSNPWTVSIDADTQNVPGMCDIPNEILEKISKSSIFLADLTFVGSVGGDSDQKPTPNPNVLFELGYAAKCLGFERLVGVINEVSGAVDGQIFDIKRRSSIKYRLSTEDTPSTIERRRKRLSEQLEEVFRRTLDVSVSPEREDQQQRQEEQFEQLRSDFASRVLAGAYHKFEALPATLITIESGVADNLNYDDLRQRLLRAGRNGQPGADSMHWGEGDRVHELHTNGVLFHAYGGDYLGFRCVWELDPGAKKASRVNRGTPVPSYLPATDFQIHAVIHAVECCELLQELQLSFPWRLGVSLVGANGFHLIRNDSKSPQLIDERELNFEPISVLSKDQLSDRNAFAGSFRKAFDRFFRTVGWDRSNCFTQNGDWNQRVV